MDDLFLWPHQSKMDQIKDKIERLDESLMPDPDDTIYFHELRENKKKRKRLLDELEEYKGQELDALTLNQRIKRVKLLERVLDEKLANFDFDTYDKMKSQMQERDEKIAELWQENLENQKGWALCKLDHLKDEKIAELKAKVSGLKEQIETLNRDLEATENDAEYKAEIIERNCGCLKHHL